MASLLQLCRRARPSQWAVGVVSAGCFMASYDGAKRRDGIKMHSLAHVHCSDAKESSGVVFRFAPKTNSFTAVFQAGATTNTASVNTNKNLLMNYARAAGNVGMKEDIYERLYSAMLREAHMNPGALTPAPGNAEVQNALRDLGLISCFSRVNDKCFSGTEAVFIDVYQPQARPLNPRNVALLYVQGSCSGTIVGSTGMISGLLSSIMGPTPRDIKDRTDFLKAIEETATNVMMAVRQYNHIVARSNNGFPKITTLQYCLIGGGPMRHPDCSKLDVAMATVSGLKLGASQECDGTVCEVPEVLLTYDDDVFQKAVAALAI